MSPFHLFVLAFLIGAFAGGLFVCYISWSFLHEKIEALDSSLHGRFTSFEQALLAKVHLVRSAPPEKPVAVEAPQPATTPTNSTPAAGA